MSRSQNTKEQKIIHPNFQLQTLLLPCSNSLAPLIPPARHSQHDMDSDFLLLDRFLPLTRVLSFLAFTNDWSKREWVSQWDSFLCCPKLQFHECKMFSVLYSESSTRRIKAPLSPVILRCRSNSNSNLSKLHHSSHTPPSIHSGATQKQNRFEKLARVWMKQGRDATQREKRPGWKIES